MPLIPQSGRTSLFRTLRRKVFSISPLEATFARRCFAAPSETLRLHLEQVGQTFLRGYHAALNDIPSDALAGELRLIESSWQGFAFEGAAMGLALLDRFSFGRALHRTLDFLNGPGAPHSYMIHVGIGWMIARLPWGMNKILSRLDPVLKWLAIDGYGFHEAYFHFPKYEKTHHIPRRCKGYCRRAFDQGFGRCLWFVKGTDVQKIAEVIEGFDLSRRPDLWSGVGLASAYAGGGDRQNLFRLREVANAYLPHIAQGVAFAAEARHRAGNVTTNTHDACDILCQLQLEDVVALVDSIFRALPSESKVDDSCDGAIPVYEIWRRRIQLNFMDRSAVSSGLGVRALLEA